jgi:hypothetical protein
MQDGAPTEIPETLRTALSESKEGNKG